MIRCRYLQILFMTLLLLGIFIQPLYSQESEFDKLTLLINQVDELNRQGRYAEAIPIAEQIVAINEKALGTNHPDIVRSLGWRALLYHNAGDYKKAESVYKRAIAICETYKQTMGQDHPDMATLLKNLSWIYRKHGNHTKADNLYTKGLQAEFKILDKMSKLMEQRRYSELIPIAEKALRDMEKEFGPEHSSVALTLSALGLAYYNLGEAIKAKPFFERALAIDEKKLGQDHPDVWRNLSGLALVYMDIGNYAKAEPLYKRTLEIAKKNLGPDHPNVADLLNRMATLHMARGDFPKAELLCKRALSINEKVLGKDSLEVAVNLIQLCLIYDTLGDSDKATSFRDRALIINANALQEITDLYDQGCYSEALSTAEKVLLITKNIFGYEHPDIVPIITHMALINKVLGNYTKAESLYKRALAVSEKAFGPEHPDVALDLRGLAALYWEIGNYTEAELLDKRALSIYKKAHGTESSKVAETLGSMASICEDQGDYTSAERLHNKSLTIMGKIYGSDHPEIKHSLHSLGRFYQSLGYYKKAESLYQRALLIAEKAFGPEHPDVASSLGNLAFVYRLLGENVKAKNLYERELYIKKKILGAEHPDITSVLCSLGRVYENIGDYAKAESLYKKALEIVEKAFGDYHLHVKYSVAYLGMFYSSIGDYTKAELLFKRAITIDEKIYGSMHPNVAQDLTTLALHYTFTGNYAKAEPLFKWALSIYEKTLGPENPRVASFLNGFAYFYVCRNDPKKAHELYKKELQIDDRLIEQIMGFTSEDEKIKYLSTKRGNLDIFLQLINLHLSQDENAKKDALDAWLKRKGVILEVQKRFQEAMFYTNNPRAVKTFQDLSRARTRISKLTFADPGKEDLEAYKKKISDLEALKDKLEAQLSKLSQPFALKKKIATADCEKVAKALPEHTVLIEFARIGALDFKIKEKMKERLSARYLVFVLPSGNGNSVGMIDLGDADIIDKAVSKFKKEIAGVKNPQDAKTIKSSGDIYKLVFQPLKKELEDIREIFISPDGNLNLIPFEILQGPDGRYLIEDYTFNYLSVGRDVLGFGQIEGKGKKALLIGDPDFDMGTDEKNITLRKLALYKADQTTICKRSSDMSVFHFKRLPGTRKEVKAIQTILGKENVRTYTGGDALEEVLKKSETPTILHLATHGFFLKDQKVRNLPDDPATRGFYSYVTPAINQMPKIRIENPMLRSGFALAGANKALAGIDETVDDGIVTAEEILSLRLRGTDMVVISACDTGLGKVKSGEGIFGLRRAFSQAGAKSLIMSLWAVPDRETKELMVEFYKNIVSGKMNRCQALRQATLKEMQIVKKRYGYANPYYWGAFVMVGDPGQQPINRKLH